MDSQMEANCREWCRSHYWQLQERRGWRYAFHESVMVRYYEEANLDPSLLEPLVEFLKGDGWQDCFTVHNKPMDMAGWKTRDVWYETRDGDVKDANKLKRTRIYHAVYKDGTQGADGPWTVEDGCKWKVTHEFYWKVASLPAVPSGSSGVRYSLQGVTREDETGLWSCVIEKRETVKQDVAKYGTAKTVFEERSEEQHLGVKQGDVATTGKEASAGGGVMVRRQVRKNDDCTSDVTNETVEEKPVAGAVTEETRTLRGTRTVTVNRNQAKEAKIGEGDMSVRNEKTDGGLWNQTITKFARVLGWFRATCRKTIFQHEHAETVAVDQDPGFTHVAVAGGGVVSEKTVSRNEEGGYDIETRTREEQSVPGAVVETRKFVDGVTVTTVNRGQPAAASASGLNIGESVRNEKTEGGLIDQTITQASVEPVGKTGEACEQNALVHTHSRTEGMGRQAQTADITSVAAGQVKTRRTRLTERGAWEVTDETRTAKPATATASGGTAGRQTTVTTYRNAAAIPAGAGGRNTDVEVTATPNEFGLVDGTVRTTKYAEKSATGGGGTDGTTVTTETHRDAPKAPQAEQGAVNKVVETSVTPNDHGSFDWTKRTTEYNEKSATGGGGTDGTTVTTETHRNSPQVPQSEAGAVNKVVDMSVSPNEHGSFDWTKRTTEYSEKSATGGGGTDGTTVTTETHRNSPQQPQAEQGEVNKVVDMSVTPNDHGSFDWTKRTTEYSEKQATGGGGTDGTTVTTETHRNSPQVPQSEAGAVNKVVDMSVSPNEHGSFDWTKRTTEYSEKSATGGGGTDGTTVTTETHRNSPQQPQAEQGAVNKVVDVSVTPNDHGSFDWTKRTTTYEEKSATATGGSYMTRETRTVTDNTTDGNPTESPERGTTYDVTAQPNDHGSFRVTKTQRTAQADIKTFEWSDKRKSATGYTEYENLLVVFRNQQDIPKQGGWDTCSPGFSINEFGLYDGTLHYQKLVNDVRVAAGAGDGGMIYSGTIVVEQKGGGSVSVPFTTYRNARGCVSSGFLNGAHNYPWLGLRSQDCGTSGIKFG